MKYSGRIIITLVALSMLVITRVYGALYYNVPLTQFPYIGLFVVLTFWMLGTQYDKLKFLSEKDVLTGIFNRRYMKYKLSLNTRL
jgi:hypothetical protein